MPLGDYERQHKEKVTKSKTDLYAGLAAHNKTLARNSKIVKVVVEYDGNGDSGEVNSVTFFDAKENEIDVPEELSNKVSDYVYFALPGGWEINEGSFGTCTIDVKEQKAHFDHNNRIESSEPDPFDD